MGSGMRKYEASGIYVYAVVEEPLREPEEVLGLDGATVKQIKIDDYLVLASTVPSKKIRKNRRNMQSHLSLQQSVMKNQSMLPVKFGTVFHDENEISKVFTQAGNQIHQNFEKLRDRSEFGIIVQIEGVELSEFLLQAAGELSRSEIMAFQDSDALSPSEKVRIRTKVREAWGRVRQQAEEVLASCCQFKHSAFKAAPSESERELACGHVLIPSDLEESLAESLSHFETKTGWKNIVIDLSGPWIPSNFVDLDLQDVY